MMNAPWQPYQMQTYRPQQGYAPQYQQGQMMEAPYQQPGMISARYVTGREEAVAAQILPDGNIWIFADVAHGRIYTKCVNPQTNSADFREYICPMQQRQEAGAQQYVTMTDFAQLKNDVDVIKAALNRDGEEMGG